jgi:hypothetical protein
MLLRKFYLCFQVFTRKRKFSQSYVSHFFIQILISGWLNIDPNEAKTETTLQHGEEHFAIM